MTNSTTTTTRKAIETKEVELQDGTLREYPVYLCAVGESARDAAKALGGKLVFIGQAYRDAINSNKVTCFVMPGPGETPIAVATLA